MRTAEALPVAWSSFADFEDRARAAGCGRAVSGADREYVDRPLTRRQLRLLVRSGTLLEAERTRPAADRGLDMPAASPNSAIRTSGPIIMEPSWPELATVRGAHTVMPLGP